jgi:hypothetical protein
LQIMMIVGVSNHRLVNRSHVVCHDGHEYLYSFRPPEHNTLRLVWASINFIESWELKCGAHNGWGGLQARVVLMFSSSVVHCATVFVAFYCLANEFPPTTLSSLINT